MSDNPVTYPEVVTIDLVNADQEYSFLFPSGIQKFAVRCLDDVDVRFSFDPGKVATASDSYGVINTGYEYYEDDLALSGTVIYFSCSTPDVQLSMVLWS